MKKIVIEGRREFSRITDADKFCDELESRGQDWYSCKANDPAPGRAIVLWGHEVELTTEEDRAEDYAILARGMARDNQIAADKFNARCEAAGREAAAKLLAGQAGYSGAAAKMFCDGFEGLSAKWSKPRTAGLEAEFRAGRAAWGSADGQRAFRAACVAARKVV